jgi:hypothetical protein
MKYMIVWVVLICATTVRAQQWHFGPKFDLHYGNIRGKGMKGSFTLGWQAGAFAEMQWNNTWGIQPELLFTWSQYKKADDFMTYYNNYGRSTASNNIRLAYISVPLLLKYHMTKSLHFLAGPQYSYLLYDDENLLKNNAAAFKKYAISAIAGVQVNISQVGFYARYNLGLSNINDIDDRYTWKSDHMQVGVAVKIN